MINISQQSQFAAATLSFEKHGDYYFYDPRSASADPNLYQEILKTAESCIWILDPYFNEDNDWQLFKDLSKDDLTIEIVTTLKDNGPSKSPACAENFAQNIIKNLNRSVSRCQVKVFYYYGYISKLWHDRYLVIDNKRVYLVGASMSNQVESKVSFGIYDLSSQNTDATNFIKRLYQGYKHVSSSNGGVYPKNRPEVQNSRRR